LKGVTLTPLQRIRTPGGDVLHALKDVDPGYSGFGEAYFTTIEAGAVKGWKRHRRMVMNLVVPSGAVRFVIHDQDGVAGEDAFQTVVLSPDGPESYARLTVQPGLWVAFAGLGSGLNLVLNLASIRHDPDEADDRPLDAFGGPLVGTTLRHPA
jgi:dTDP-4-dehydrorhamnose 3,5-epimerase